MGSWGMNQSAEKTNRPRTASRFSDLFAPRSNFFAHEPRKKDIHSLIKQEAHRVL